MAASLEMLNCNISAMVQLITMKVGSVMHTDCLKLYIYDMAMDQYKCDS